jgi:hypothetical protein
MQSIAVNNEKSLKGDRPNLSINTNLPRKKKSWRLFSGRDNSKTKSFSPKLLKHTSLPIPCPPSPPTAISLKPIRNTIAPMFSKNSSNDELLKSADSNSVHSTGSVHNTLKKFHLPQFHKRSNSQQHKSTATVIEERMYTPTAPEPIMPTLVDWSPQEPISPPPWELSPSNNKRHSLMFQVEADYHSDSEIDRLNSSDVSPTTINSSDITLTAVSINSSSSYDDSSSAGTRLKRRSSCPTYDTLSVNSSTSSKTLVENDIIAITEQHTRYMSVLKKYTHPADKKPVFKSCQKVKARAAEAAANGESVHVSNSIYSSFCEESLKYLYIPNVFDPVTREPVLEFSAIKPRKYQLYRKTSWKREAKALLTWHHLLEDKIRKPTPLKHLPKELLIFFFFFFFFVLN